MKDSEQSNQKTIDVQPLDQPVSMPVEPPHRRPLASTPLVVFLLVILLGVVLVQGALLLGLYSQTKQTQDTEAEQSREIPALVAKPTGNSKSNPATVVPAPQPTSPLQAAPLGSPFPDDFFSDDWQPFAEMARMRERMNKLFEDSFTRFRSMPNFDEDWLNLGSSFAGNAAIREEDGKYIVTFDLPGADESSINIKLEDNRLSISGNREEVDEQRDNQGNVLRQSRSISNFQNAFTLPGPAEASGMTSSYKDGVLTITIPKASNF